MEVFTILIREDDWETLTDYVGSYSSVDQVISFIKDNFFDYDDNPLIDVSSYEYNMEHCKKLMYQTNLKMLPTSNLDSGYVTTRHYYIYVYKDTLE